MKTYRVGIVGCGFIGKVHAYAHANLPYFFADLPFRTRVTHVCTSRASTADAAKAVTGADVSTLDFRRVTESPDVDIVHICTPNSLHCEQLLSAMAANKHIYCDKPLTATVEEAERIARAAESYEGTFQMTFQNRFFPASLRAHQIMSSGVLGQILQFRAAFLHGGSADPEAPLKWKLQAASGGGVVADLGSHVLDLVTHLLGDIRAVNALTPIAYEERPAAGHPGRRAAVDAEDAMLVLAEMQTGAAGTIEATKLASGTEDELRLEIHGSSGALRYNSMDPHHLEWYDCGVDDRPLGGHRGWTRIDCGQRYNPPAGFPGPKLSIGWLRSHVQCLYEFLAALHAGHRADPGLSQGLYIQRLMGAVLTSARDRDWVRIAPRSL